MIKQTPDVGNRWKDYLALGKGLLALQALPLPEEDLAVCPSWKAMKTTNRLLTASTLKTELTVRNRHFLALPTRSGFSVTPGALAALPDMCLGTT